MGPGQQPELSVVGGVDHAVDQVKRRNAFVRAHPEVSILSPSQTGNGRYKATWTVPGGDGEETVREVTNPALRFLLDELDGLFRGGGPR